MKKISRIFIVDDHPMVRLGLRDLIQEEKDLDVCGEAGSAAEALSGIEESKPDLIIVDLSLEKLGGLELIKQIRSREPESRILVYSMHDESLYAERALHAGSMGYINKEAPTVELVQAIRRVLEGKIYLSEEMSEKMLRRMAEGKEAVDAGPLSELTDREIEIFEMIGRGKGTRKIASDLHLSVKTVDAHRQNIKAKLGLSDSNELIQHAVKWVLENK